MANKIVKSEIFEINISSLNKAQKTIYNKVSKNNKLNFSKFEILNLFIKMKLIFQIFL